MNLTIPELALVVLVGPSGSGKSTFARNYFKPTEVVSSDYCRGLISDDENDQGVSKEAFDLLHTIVGKRLAHGRMAVVDATSVQPASRKPLIQIARQYHCLPVAIVFNLPERICIERNRSRPDRNFGHHVIRNQKSQMRRGLRQLKREGFRYIYTLDSEEAVNSVRIERQPLWNNRRMETGPFDIVGDIHGCYDELTALLSKLGYQFGNEDLPSLSHPDGRRLIFLGDLVDRGPQSPRVLRLVMKAVAEDMAYCVPGNHDAKLLRKLRGRNVQITHGLAETLEQMEKEDAAFREEVAGFIDSLVSHYVFDDGKLVVAHAGMKEEMQGRGSGAVRQFALYGETTGETDEFGLPVRYDWASAYRGRAMVVYGHTPVPEPEWLNNTINIDTGCVFGGSLSALRYPERELVSIPAQHIYAEPAKPFLEKAALAPQLSAQQSHDDLLDISDVTGKRIIATRLRRNVSISEENNMAALEIMSRFAVNPKWLIHLPPTMSPCETSRHESYLEFPNEAFEYYRNRGIPEVVCEEKHMGSRAIVVVCRDEKVAKKRFGIVDGGFGCVYTRTGRPFFNDNSLQNQLLEHIINAVTESGLWEELKTDWLCLDCELMPWSWKARELLKSQYAPAAASAESFNSAAIHFLDLASSSDDELAALRDRFQYRKEANFRYRQAYRNYCWKVDSLSDLKLAPFHILAFEGAVNIDRDHLWHMDLIHRICGHDQEVLLKTRYKAVNVTDESQIKQGTDWWLEMTANGGEGMVVKPLEFIAHGSKGILQPAIKCRGPEYLRIIYGPEYDAPQNIERLRSRGLGVKRSLALREFALGVESLERFVRREPLRRVHECVFGVLAFESEPVDPRL